MTTCQHCAAPAPADRTFCPSCRRRLRPTDAIATQPVDVAATPAAEMTPPSVVTARQPRIEAAVSQQSFATALAVAVAVAAGGVVGWVVLAQTMHVRSALVALVVAAGTAAAFRRYAPADGRAPIAIVGLTVLSALLGLLASQYALLADAVHVDYFTVVERLPLSKVPRLMTAGTTPMTWIIVALSVYSGARYSARLRQVPHRLGELPKAGSTTPGAQPPSAYPAAPPPAAQPSFATPSGAVGPIPEPTPEEEEKWRRFAQGRDE